MGVVIRTVPVKVKCITHVLRNYAYGEIYRGYIQTDGYSKVTVVTIHTSNGPQNFKLGQLFEMVD